jgi:uncharacterized membrane protein
MISDRPARPVRRERASGKVRAAGPDRPLRIPSLFLRIWILMHIALGGAVFPCHASGPAASVAAEARRTEDGTAKGTNTVSVGTEESFSVVEETIRPPGEDGAWRNLADLAGRMHPILTHFPVAWILLAAGLEWAALWIAWRNSRTRRGSVPGVRKGPEQAQRLGTASLILLILAAASSVAAAASGYLLAATKETDAALTLHSRLAYATVALGMLALAARLFSRKPGRDAWRLVSALLLAAAAATVGYAGHVGGSLVYGEGYPFTSGGNP